MNGRTKIGAVLTPLILVVSLVIAIPLLLSDEACGFGDQLGTPSEGITVATWNLWGEAGDRAGNPLVDRQAFITARIRSVGPDVMMLQEAARKSGATFQPYLEQQTGLTAAGPLREHRRILYNATRLVLRDSGRWTMPGPYSRSSVYAKFFDTRTQQEFVAVSTHLEHRRGRNATRTRQMRTVKAHVERYAGDLPVVIGGDLNTNKFRPDGNGPVNMLQSAGWVNTASAASKTNKQLGSAMGTRGLKTRVVTHPGEGSPLDYVFGSPGTTVHWWAIQPQAPIADDRYTRINSDHNIVTTGITFKGVASSTPPSPAETPSADASPAAATTRVSNKIPDRVGRWKGQQLKNAATIAATGKQLGISKRGQAIAIMTAMGESSLLAVDRGDAAGPDSRGLFQQRTSWGSYADRMDPAKSAALFYKALQRVSGWAELEPTQAAHRVQRNADPNHYAKFWDEAMAVYAATEGITLTASDLSSFAPECVGDDAMEASYNFSGADCDFGKYKNPNTCQQALAKAAQISKTSACRSNLSGGNWRRWCLAFVAQAYGRQFAGYPTAMSMYRSMKAKGLVKTGKQIPAGALVWFSSSSPAGHVALYAGDGKAFSNDYVRSGCIDLTPMSRMGAGGRYLGWSPPSFPGA